MSEIIKINNYSFNRPLTNNNSGFSKWGIGERNGKKYFVKEFLAPIYPGGIVELSPEKKEKRIRLCEDFVKEKKQLYMELRQIQDGHIVTVEQFFRSGTKYYMSTRAVIGKRVPIDELMDYMFIERLKLCCAVAYSFSKIHSKRIVHSDVKPDNVLLIQRNGSLIPNIIDFDCSFFEHKCPKLGEELNGDIVYLSPEGYLVLCQDLVQIKMRGSAS